MDKETAIMVIQSIPKKIWNQLGPAENEAIEMMYFEFDQNQWHPYPETQPNKVKCSYLVQTGTGWIGECRWSDEGRIWADLKVDWHWIGVPQYGEVVAWRPMIDKYVKRGGLNWTLLNQLRVVS